MRQLLLALFLVGCGSAPLPVPKNEPGSFDTSCAAKGSKACEVACEDGSPDACLILANAYDKGEQKPRNHKRRNELEEKACAMGSMRGCAWLSRSLRGTDRSVELRARACDGGFTSMCPLAAADALRANEAETGFERLQRACEYEEWDSCAALADLYRYGVGTTAEAVKAEEFYELACEHDSRNACRTLQDPDTTYLTAPIASANALHSPNPSASDIIEAGVPSGTTKIEFCIGGDGRTTSVEVEESGGSPVVDVLSAKAVESWRFEVRGLPSNAVLCSKTEFKFSARSP